LFGRIAFFTVPMAISCCWLSGRPEGTARPGGGAGKAEPVPARSADSQAVGRL